MPGSARSEALAYMMELASRPYSWASASLALSWRSTTWLWVQASSNTRSARWRSWYLSIRPRHCVAGLADAGDDVHRGRLLGLQRQPVADRDDRVEHRPLVSRQRAGGLASPAAPACCAAADELHAVGLVGNLADVGAVHRHQMHHPRRPLRQRARPPRAQDGALARQDFGLHEQVAERRMRRHRRRPAPAPLPHSW